MKDKRRLVTSIQSSTQRSLSHHMGTGVLCAWAHKQNGERVNPQKR